MRYEATTGTSLVDDRCIESWIQEISDLTPLAHQMHAHIEAGDLESAQAMLPAERVYHPQVAALTDIGL